MGELKPIGSEKLSGDAKMKRILELTYYQSENSSTRSAEVVKEAKSGVYGIEKEKDGYYVKKGLNERSLDYIGGMFMKNKNRFSSYGEAIKKLEFLIEQEQLQEAVKYVLKQNKPAPAPQVEAPAPAPTNELPPAPAAPDATAMDSPEAGTSPVPGDELGGEASATPEDPNDYMKVIQKMTGKLTQKLETYKDKLESKDIKYVINMVLGSVNLDALDDADETEIMDNFGTEEEVPAETPDLGSTGDEAPPAAEDELGETGGMGGMDALEQLVNSPFDDDNVGANEYEFENDDEIPIPIDEPDFGDDEEEIPLPKEHSGFGDDEDEDVVDFSTFDVDDNEPVHHDVEPKKSEEELSKGNAGFSMNEEDPIPSDEERELDIDELNNMVSTSVKETLSKYFS